MVSPVVGGSVSGEEDNGVCLEVGNVVSSRFEVDGVGVGTGVGAVKGGAIVSVASMTKRGAGEASTRHC